MIGFAQLLVLGSLLAPPANAADRELLREFMRVTGTRELARRTRDDVITHARVSHPDAPDSFWQKRALEIPVEDLERRLERAYAKQFTDDELRAIIAFYKTPAGLKLTRIMPQLAQESLGLAQGWGQAQLDATLQALRQAGYGVPIE